MRENRRCRAPRGAQLTLAAMLALQVGLECARPLPAAQVAEVPQPLPAAALRTVSLGEREALAHLMLLYLQSADLQPGVSIPLHALDYTRVAAWLASALALDPRSHYPLALAAHVYAQAPDASRQRLMLEFVHRAFLEDPEARWRWLAHCAIVARHRLRDPQLALRYAEDIAAHAGGAAGWARQMRIFLLADLGETQHARALLGALLASGEVSDPQERRFLAAKLDEMAGKAGP